MSEWQNFEERIAAASAAELDGIDHELFGRKSGTLTVAMKELGSLTENERKTKAQELNTWKKKLTELIAGRRVLLASPSNDALASGDRIDISLERPQKPRGRLHPIPEFMRQVEEVFGRMGFDTAYGPEIETEENNFNKLNIPETHPARDTQDTFWIKGVKNTVLRTHTSPVQIRYMQEKKPPFRMICPGKTYRKDADATHSPMFHQFEGLMIGKDVSLANLKAVLITAIRELIGRDVEFRFRTGFFPFVEPGLEMDMLWQGDPRESKEGKWLEMGGCGMVHPNVLENCGINPKESGKPRRSRPPWQGFAFGFGIERPLMIKHRIPDLRSFYEGDPRFLRQF